MDMLFSWFIGLLLVYSYSSAAATGNEAPELRVYASNEGLSIHEAIQIKLKLHSPETRGGYYIAVARNPYFYKSRFFHSSKKFYYLDVRHNRQYYIRVFYRSGQSIQFSKTYHVDTTHGAPLKISIHKEAFLTPSNEFVDRSRSAPEIHKAITEEYYLRKLFEVSLGLGINVVNFDQEVFDLLGVSYTSFKGPSSFLQLSIFPWKYLKLNGSYKSTPGTIGDETQQETYSWQILSGTADVQLTPSNQFHFWSLVGGVHRHTFPFLKVELSDQYTVVTHNLMTTSIGFEYTYFIDQNWRFLWSQNIQFPIDSSLSSGENLEIISNGMLDGSISARYLFSPTLWTGVYWYGQMQSFDYKSGKIDNGSQQLLFSNFELRAGYLF